jgi:tetratricopeptide (TPR) repeat protein
VDQARELLLGALAAQPWKVELGEELEALVRREVGRLVSTARAAREAGWRGQSLELLESASRLKPLDQELAAERLLCAADHLAALRAAAEEAEADDARERAAAAWTDYLRLDPLFTEGRRALGRLRAAEARQLDEAARASLSNSGEDAAIDLLRRAQELQPDQRRAAELRRLEAERCFRAGVERYEAGRIAEAAFQLRKALALDPEHAEAARRLGFAEAGGPAGEIRERFSRLEE